MSRTKEEVIEKLIMVLQDLDGELGEIQEIVPIDNHVVGLQVICQFRNRETPKKVETLRLEHGEPVAILDDGDVTFSEPGGNDFPPIIPFGNHIG